MINRLKIMVLTTILAFTSSLFAVNVTLNVDMSNVTVSENGVHVAGSFQGVGTQQQLPLPMMMEMVSIP